MSNSLVKYKLHEFVSLIMWAYNSSHRKCTDWRFSWLLLIHWVFHALVLTEN
jgi:hypothetical protein